MRTGNVVAALADRMAPDLLQIGSTWEPQPKQVIANQQVQIVGELLYGGAAGGGKTEWLINYASELMERHARNRGVIFRRVFPSLNRTVVSRAKEILESTGRARWNGNDHTFSFKNGSVLELASLQYRDDVLKFYGAEYGFVGFEEITEFLLFQYEYMLGRLRAPADGIRPHAASTTNPGGLGHAWVKARFIELSRDTDVRKGRHCSCGCGFATRPSPFEPWHPAPTPEQPDPMTRCFVPARVEDNPALTRRDPGYMNRLLGAISDRGLRRALADGDWDAIDAVEGALISAAELDLGRIPPERIPQTRRRVLAVDTSDGKQEGDEYGVAVVALGLNGHVYVEHSDGWSAKPKELSVATVELAHDMGVDKVVVERNHGGKWVPAMLRGEDEYLNIGTVWASQGKLVRWEPVAALFGINEEGDEPRAHLVGFHPELEDEMTSFTGALGERSPNRLDAVVWGVNDLLPRGRSGGGRIHVPRGQRGGASSTRLAINQRTFARRQ